MGLNPKPKTEKYWTGMGEKNASFSDVFQETDMCKYFGQYT
jgi:hypothetical protein